jgi:hypothetical protein
VDPSEVTSASESFSSTALLALLNTPEPTASKLTSPTLAQSPSLPTQLELVQTTQATLVGVRSVPLSPSISHQVKFYASLAHAHQMTGVVMSPNEKIVAVLDGLTSTNIVEDLEGDGQFELVVRQFNQTPQMPIRVYRFTNGAYHLDPTIASLFQ